MVSKNRSHRANHYGTLAERKAADRYRLTLERCSWHDAKREDGTPVEVKAAMYEHADGQPGNFKIYDKYHQKLRRANGWYVFVPYRPRGRGIQTIAMQMRHSSRLPRLDWHGGGEHRGTQQAKIDLDRIFE